MRMRTTRTRVSPSRVSARAHALAFARARARAHDRAHAAGGSLGPSLRVSAGVGVALPTQLGLVELNLPNVLRRRPEDAVVKNGIQIGISTGVA